jgi:predicted alpha/beta-fold hydrolase
MNSADTFTPPFYLRNPLLQTVLASNKLRNLWSKSFIHSAEEKILSCSNGTRLQGFLSRAEGRKAKGLVILHHGWEGSADSAYMVSTGKLLFENGYDVFRLNMRDHGETHHLNRGVFYGTLIEEAFEADTQIAASAGDLPVFIAGFSMGGNFSIRIARLHRENPVNNMRHVVCINPALDPMLATQKIDEMDRIRNYFLKKWKRSLRKKQALFPDLYDFSHILEMDNTMEMTEVLIREMTDYGDAATYFGAYTLKEGYLDSLNVPLTIITSSDDPVIPVKDFHETKMNGYVTLDLQEYGGHCGYINSIAMTSWCQPRILSILNRTITQGN